VLAAFNATPTPRHGYRLGVPRGGRWIELANSDASGFGGSGLGNLGGVDTEPVGSHGFDQSITLTLPPLGAVFLAPEQ
jgi:1,4-alpha-glucan branching enzyme